MDKHKLIIYMHYKQAMNEGGEGDDLGEIGKEEIIFWRSSHCSNPQARKKITSEG